MCAQEPRALAAAWWASYNLAPPAARNEQNVKQSIAPASKLLTHLPSSKDSSFRSQRMFLAKMEAFFPAFARAVEAVGRQLGKAGHEHFLADRPASEDPMLRKQLVLVSRSSAMQLYKRRKCAILLRGRTALLTSQCLGLSCGGLLVHLWKSIRNV